MKSDHGSMSYPSLLHLVPSQSVVLGLTLVCCLTLLPNLILDHNPNSPVLSLTFGVSLSLVFLCSSF